MLRDHRGAVLWWSILAKLAMFTIFYKIVVCSDPEVDHTKSKPNRAALHTYVDLVSKRVGALLGGVT